MFFLYYYMYAYILFVLQDMYKIYINVTKYDHVYMLPNISTYLYLILNTLAKKQNLDDITIFFFFCIITDLDF